MKHAITALWRKFKENREREEKKASNRIFIHLYMFIYIGLENRCKNEKAPKVMAWHANTIDTIAISR